MQKLWWNIVKVLLFLYKWYGIVFWETSFVLNEKYLKEHNKFDVLFSGAKSKKSGIFLH